MAALPPPHAFKKMVNKLIDYAEQGVVPDSQIPAKLDRRCTLALNELQQANQYAPLGEAYSRETFVHLHRFTKLLIKAVGGHPDFAKSAHAQQLVEQGRGVADRMEAIRARWLEAYYAEIELADLEGDHHAEVALPGTTTLQKPPDAIAASVPSGIPPPPSYASSVAAYAGAGTTAPAYLAASSVPATTPTTTHTAPPAPSAPPPSYDDAASAAHHWLAGPPVSAGHDKTVSTHTAPSAAVASVSDADWKRALAALTLGGISTSTASTASGTSSAAAAEPMDALLPTYLSASSPASHTGALAAYHGPGKDVSTLPQYPGIGDHRSEPRYTGPTAKAGVGGHGDPMDGTMGWCRGYEGGRGMAELKCGGILKNVLRWPTSDLGTLRNMYIPMGIIETFISLASANSSLPPRGIETCGILAGKISPNGAVTMTTLIVPDQKGDADSCELTDRGEMQVFETCSGRDLIQMGWIHTHPSQECFMSSYDVRTHLGFQTMLHEAVAIVAAPRDPKLRYGVFRLIEPDGFEIVRSRPTDNHYHVPPGVYIYETTSHVKMVQGRSTAAASSGHGLRGGKGASGIPLDCDDFNVVDLRRR